MRIVQVLPTMGFGDAIGNDTLALRDALVKMGFETAIYADVIDQRYKSFVMPFEDCDVTEEDVILYHLSVGSRMNYAVADLPGHLVVIYHNVTPPEYFEDYELPLAEICREGVDGVKFLAPYAEYAMADSEFNKQELIRYGYTCQIDVLPILIAFDDYDKKPSRKVMRKYKHDGYTNILFTGRIAPNKKQEDVIAAFDAYKKHYNSKARLILVGTNSGERYQNRLMTYAQRLGVEDVIFTGHIPFDEILAYYRVADVFLCMSEHEGFCVPLVEAMKFDVPVVAYDSTAIGETLGGSGFLMDTKNPNVVAGVVNRICTDEQLRNTLVENERLRLQDFQHDVIAKEFERLLKKYIGRL